MERRDFLKRTTIVGGAIIAIPVAVFGRYKVEMTKTAYTVISKIDPVSRPCILSIKGCQRSVWMQAIVRGRDEGELFRFGWCSEHAWDAFWKFPTDFEINGKVWTVTETQSGMLQRIVDISNNKGYGTSLWQECSLFQFLKA